MILNDLRELETSNAALRRTVIIGGGTVGLYAATELTNRGEEVVVVEAGGQALSGFPVDSYSSVGKPNEGIKLGRSRCLGGTSNLWGGQLVEFQPVDFEGRAWLEDSKWPITYEEIAPYYESTYTRLGIARDYQDDSSVYSRVGDMESEFDEGLELFLTRWLKIPSFTVAFSKAIQNDPKLRIVLNCAVVGFEGTGGVLTGVKVKCSNGNSAIVSGNRFILASGTVEISRLLLHAATGSEWDCPWRNNQNVGAFFQDHPVGRVAEIEVLNRKRFFKLFSTVMVGGYKFQPKVRFTNEALKSSGSLNIHAMMMFESSVSENLVYLKQFLKAAIYSRRFTGLRDLFVNVLACGKHLLPLMWKYAMDNRIFVPSNSKTSLVVQSEQTPLRGSRIYLDQTHRDPWGLPRVVLDWQIGSAELRSIRDFVMRCDRAFQNAGLARLTIDQHLLDLDARFSDALRDNYHHAGGARIGANADDGVVDKNLRVFGTNNLFVIGAATFRTSSNANTTLTALAFTTRLVDQLLRDSGNSEGGIVACKL